MDWRAECLKVHNEGLASLVRDGRLPFRLRPYDDLSRQPPDDLILQGGVSDVARILLETVVTKAFRRFQIPAALIQCDTMQVSSRDFAAHFGLSPEMSFDEYQKEYLRILNGQFGGTMANLPRSLWSDAVVTGVKGPKIDPICICSPYHKDDSGKIVADPAQDHVMGFINVLPDWWEPVVN